MAVAIEGSGNYKGLGRALYDSIVYKRRCGTCGCVGPGPLITVSALPYGTVVQGPHHAESYVCFFCGNRQAVKIEG